MGRFIFISAEKFPIEIKRSARMRRDSDKEIFNVYI